MKRVFVIGAGASAASCDTPLGRELVWNYHMDSAELVPIVHGVPDTSEEDQRFRNFPSFLELAERYYPDLKGEKDRYMRRECAFYSPPPYRPYVDQILDLVQAKGDREGTELIRTLIFEHLVEATPVKMRGPTLYDEFNRNVLSRLEPQDVCVISTNFDYLLSEHFQLPISFDYCLDFDSVDPNRSSYKKHPAVPLIKLNGSLDWGRCAVCGRLYLFFPHMYRTFFENRRCDNGCGLLRPLIVVPHERHTPEFRGLWTQAEEALSDADVITVIGYSFPKYDLQTIELFRNTISASTELEVIDYCGVERDRAGFERDLGGRYKKLFPSLQHTRIDPKGFRKYVERHSSS